MKGEFIIPIKGIEVEFKKINIDDFDEKYYKVDKETIRPNKQGYLSDSLKPILNKDFATNNTTVINAGVGQGKSQTIMDKVLDYSTNKDYVVIIAVPYNSLIEQYEKDCIARGIKNNKIFNLTHIEEYYFLKKDENFNRYDINLFDDENDVFRNNSIADFNVHIMTINALLGNSGDNHIHPSNIRNDYFGQLINYCSTKNKKLIVIFDEIHDAINNFKEIYIYHLWNFKGLIHKIFIISATFNEASKEVIKYLSEFTDKKILIIESERTIVSEKQSRLNIIFNDYQKISNNSFFKELIERLLREKESNNEKVFDIIVYSKTQIQQLLKTPSFSLIKKELNLCYNDVFDFDNDNNKNYNHHNGIINIGTNFTTGVNIKKKEHTYIIVLPKRLNIPFVDNRGVFKNGVNTIIQTLARQRLPGDIFIIMPTPFHLNIKNLPYTSEIKSQLSTIFNKFSEGKQIEYSDINSERKSLSDAYEKLIALNKKAIKEIEKSNRVGMNSLVYPSKERFILDKGELFLSHRFFDGDLSTYTFFAAITNQFLNCKINMIYRDNKIILDKDNLTEFLTDMYNDYASRYVPGLDDYYVDEKYSAYYSEYHIFNKLFDTIPKKEIYFEEGETKATPAEITLIKRSLLMLVVTHGNKNIIENYSPIALGKALSKIYFKSSVKFSEITLNEKNKQFFTKTSYGDEFEISKKHVQVITHYQKWKLFIDIIENDIFVHKRQKLLSKSPSNIFSEKFRLEKFDTKIEEIFILDPIINENIIPFRDSYSKSNKKDEFFYSLLVESFFDKHSKDSQPLINGKRDRHYKDVSRVDLSQFSINLLYEKIPYAIL